MKGRGSASAVIGKISAPPPAIPDDAPLRMPIQMLCPVEDKLRDFVLDNRHGSPVMAKHNQFEGQTLALCAAGPSLNDHEIHSVDQVWACNSALPHLIARGVKVTAGIGIDQSPGLLREWESAPDVLYYVASSCDPELIKHLRAKGRTLRFFHNAVGIEDEHQLYKSLYPKPALVVTNGSTVVSRVIGLATWMGFSRIDVYGADCCVSKGLAHANGETTSDAYGSPLLMKCAAGIIDDREWITRPDMLMTAVELCRWARTSDGRLRLVGDTLPNALIEKDDAFLDLVIRRLAPGEGPPDEPQVNHTTHPE